MQKRGHSVPVKKNKKTENNAKRGGGGVPEKFLKNT